MVSSYLASTLLKVINLGISKHFHSDFKAEEILKEHKMDVESLVGLVKENYNK